MEKININEMRNPEYVLVGSKRMRLDDLINDYVNLKRVNKKAPNL